MTTGVVTDINKLIEDLNESKIASDKNNHGNIKQSKPS